MKVILVTGGNRGIGLEICRQLGAMGHIVILGSRNLEKGILSADSLQGNVIAKQLDVTKEESIQEVFSFINKQFGKLDIIINNAGISEISYTSNTSTTYKVKSYLEQHFNFIATINKTVVPFLRRAKLLSHKKGVGEISLTSVKEVMETNLYGPWRMIQVFVPLLEKSNDARIINVSSGMGALDSLTGTYPGYSMSKASLNALTIMFSNELKEKNIKVNAMCPGWVKTDMGGINAPREVAEGADTAIWLATEENIHSGGFYRDRKIIKW